MRDRDYSDGKDTLSELDGHDSPRQSRDDSDGKDTLSELDEHDPPRQSRDDSDSKDALSELDGHDSPRQSRDDDLQQMIAADGHPHILAQPPNLMLPQRTRGRKVPPRRRDPMRPFECPLCHRAFGRVDHLQRHIGVHLADKPFECVYCRKTFSRKDNIKIHQETMHREQLGLPPRTLRPTQVRRSLISPQQPSPAASNLSLSRQHQVEPLSPGQRRSPRQQDSLPTSFDFFVNGLYEADLIMSHLLYFSAPNTPPTLQSSSEESSDGGTTKRRRDPGHGRRT